ncbi:MAG: hypothetical protein L0H55_15965, partial [Candidatus Nitrosocosmicus sp.]|nr:hypothetical protein [Candidatus Nitrosocosmicus sp.]
MTTVTSSNYLDIDIHDSIQDKVHMIRVTPELDVLIEGKEISVIGKIEFKKIGKSNIMDFQKTVEKIIEKLKEQKVEQSLSFKIGVSLSKSNTKLNE